MAREKESADPQDVWGLFGTLFGITYCAPEHCVSHRAESVEDCWVEEEDEDFEAAVRGTKGGSVSNVVTLRTMPPAGAAEFKIPWADMGGDTAVGSIESTKNHSLLPLSSAQNREMMRPLSPPPFRTGIPVKAYLYQPDVSDAIDIELHKHLRSLSEECLNVLALLRIEPGKYEVDGRRAQIYRTGKEGCEFRVHEDEVGPSFISDMSLRAYLNLVANVAMSLRRRGVCPTFDDRGSPTLQNARDDDRYRAMRMACTQAELRESSQYYSSLS